MKKIFTIIIAIMAIAVPLSVKADSGNSIPTPIILETHPEDDEPEFKPHRAPMRVGVEAWYDSNLGTISISYSGEANGEVNLYCDGVLVDNSSEINTTFMVADHGLYTIEILTDSWTATGSISL